MTKEDKYDWRLDQSNAHYLGETGGSKYWAVLHEFFPVGDTYRVQTQTAFGFDMDVIQFLIKYSQIEDPPHTEVWFGTQAGLRRADAAGKNGLPIVRHWRITWPRTPHRLR